VVDVTIRHKDGSTLDHARQCKLDKYTPIVEELKMRMGAVIPIITGTRGGILSKMVEALRQLNIINKKVLVMISLIALHNSINIYKLLWITMPGAVWMADGMPFSDILVSACAALGVVNIMKF